MATNNAGEPRPIVVVAMMMMMMATVVVALPPTTFPPPYTTFPPGCQTDDGDVLRPGEHSQSNDGGCKMCFCSWDGQLSCYYADCIVAMCVDQVKSPGACCARCPNGRNCRIERTGEVISAGSPVHRDGMVCECPPQNYMLPGVQTEADITAICHDMTTMPPTTVPIPVGRR